MNETLYYDSSSFSVPQATPSVTEARAIDIGRGNVQFIGPPSTPLFTPGPPVAINALLGFVRISARP